MKNPTRFTVPLLTSAVALAAALATPAFGQAKAGLNALDESAVYIELAGREMSDLLNRAFDVDKVPEAQRKEIMAGLALQRIATINPQNLTPKQARDLVSQLKGNLDKTITAMKDPTKISRVAANIMVVGVLGDVSVLEFWGEDPAVQAQLNPAAETVAKLYAQAEAQLTVRMNAVANRIQNPNQVDLLAELDKIQGQLTMMTYSKMNTNYFVALSLDKANERRKKICDESITYLHDFDNAESGVQADIKLNSGKMMIAKGDYPAAVTKLKELWEKPQDVKPDPTPAQQATARQFTAIAELLAGNLDAAEKILKDGAAWRETNIKEKTDADLLSDTAAVLQARIHWARADKAADAAEKAKHNDAASAVLVALRKQRPGLASLIDDRIITRMPANIEMGKLDPLLLQAMIGRGKGELTEDPGDKDKLTKALNAAKELAKRKGVDDATMENTMILIPVFAEKLGDNKEAAAGFLNYVQFPKAEPKNREKALDSAMYLILTKLNGGKPDNNDPFIADLYDRAVPLAINPPYNHKELAYAWARRMQRLKNTDEAIKYFRMVPADHPSALQAKYYLAIALNTKLDDPKLPAAQRTAIATEILKTADEVDKAAAAGLANAKDDKKKQFQAMLGGVKLTSALVALDVQNDPKRALDLLKDIETTVAGILDAENMVLEATTTRIRAYMAAGQDKEAIALVLDLFQKRPNEAIGMIGQLNQRVGKEVAKAKGANDMKRVAQLAPVRAKLTEILADWIRNNKDPKIKAQTFPADSQLADVKREAALLEEDPVKRKKLLGEVAKIYQNLMAAPEAKADPKTMGSLEAGLAFIYYDIGEYQKCLDLLLPLLNQRRLGSAYIFVNGEREENPLYWEGRFKQLKSIWEIGKQANDEKKKGDVAKELRNIYEGFSNPGGSKWGNEFEAMRKEIDPTIDPNGAKVDAEPAPATQPAKKTDIE